MRGFYNLYLAKEKEFARNIRNITGYAPRELFLYHLAMKHSSLVTTRKRSAQECNERLEFLGDTVLDSVVSEYLFKLYPTQDEGFLTEMRAKIVNRTSLNDICKRLNINSLLRFQQNRKGQVNRSMYGDALEAFIGAIYLDLGYERTKRFIIRRILVPLIDLKQLERRIYNFKSMLLEYVQKEKLASLSYELVEENGEGNDKFFRIQVMIGTEVMGVGDGRKKKVAEQMASQDALVRLRVLDPADPHMHADAAER